MAVTVTDNRAVRNEADATTGWTGTATLALYTTDPTPVESTGQIGANVGAVEFDAYHTATAADLSDAVIYQWVFSRVAQGNRDDTNGGLMIYVGDGTHAGAWKVNGADFSPFRHDTGPTGWTCAALDTTSLPASPVNKQGSGGASVDFTLATRVGIAVNSLVGAPGMNPTFHFDIVRILDPSINNGCAVTVTGGTSGTPGLFSEIATADRLTGNLQAHGVIRELATGAYGCQAPLRFGNPTGTDSSWFEDTNATLIFEDRRFRTTLYKIFITDNGTGTTTFRLGTKVGTGATATGADGCALIAPPGVGAEFDAATDTDVTDVFIYGSRIVGFTGGVKFQSGHEFIGGVISGSGLIEPNGATMVNTAVADTTDATRALLWNIATDPDGLLDGTSYSGSGHAIEFGITSPVSLTLNDIDFSGYTNTVDSTSAPLHIRRTTGTVNITANDCTGLTASGYRTDGAIVVISLGSRTVTAAVVDASGVAVTGSRVFVQAATGGPFPYQDSVTITRSTTTATVAHTAHGLVTNDLVLIAGITDKVEDNAVQTITRINDDSYSYTTTDSGSTNYTGTIVSTFVFLNGLANAGTGSNEISMTREIPSNQPITGWARRSTSAPFYKPGTIAGTVISTGNSSFVAVMVSDD